LCAIVSCDSSAKPKPQNAKNKPLQRFQGCYSIAEAARVLVRLREGKGGAKLSNAEIESDCPECKEIEIVDFPKSDRKRKRKSRRNCKVVAELSYAKVQRDLEAMERIVTSKKNAKNAKNTKKIKKAKKNVKEVKKAQESDDKYNNRKKKKKAAGNSDDDYLPTKAELQEFAQACDM